MLRVPNAPRAEPIVPKEHIDMVDTTPAELFPELSA